MDIPSRTLRLKGELQIWLRGDPIPGFLAKPVHKNDGSLNFLEWECVIPGKVNTPWEGGDYQFRLIFDEEYPANPPKCLFNPILFHPNILPCGLALLPPNNFNWKPENSIKRILFTIQEFLARPTIDDQCCLNEEAYDIYCKDKARYNRLVQDQALRLYLNTLPLYGGYYPPQ